MNHSLLLAGFMRGASLAARETGSTTDRSVMEAILLNKFKTEGQNGRMIISVMEQGGETRFAVPEGLGSVDILALAEAALQRLDAQPNKNTFDLRRVRAARRLRVSFAGAQV